MRKIKILNLYGEALDLNGDGKNVTAFEKRIAEMGYEYETTELGVGDDIDVSGYDIVFMTHGKPHNVSALSEHFIKYKDNIINNIENGKVFVVTGSTNMLFGKSFSMLDGKTYEGIGLFDCTAEEFDSLYVSDAVLAPDFAPEEKMFGTYYRCESVKFNTPNKNRLFKVLKADEGKGSIGEGEGCHYKNLFATWCLGPVLVRNPLMMREVLHCVLGEDYRETDFSLEEKAVKMIIEELS
ncbi:MAG: hypothetical protein IKL57_02460 [Oscillospiraceae bacterium]|nr:hypothetical protein [Oscillospiraceae bacterium]